MNNEVDLNINNTQGYSSQSIEKDIRNNQINSKLITLFETEISEIFPNILYISKNEFISFIESKIKSTLKEQYPNDNIYSIFKNKKFTEIFNKNMNILHDKYSLYMKELNESWENYKSKLSSKKIINEELYFSDFRKHCIKTGKFALHKCSQNKYGEYLSVLHKSSIDGSLSIRYLICTKCKKAYFTSLFLNYCRECDTTYYSNKLLIKEKSEFELATYDPPHCKSLFNKKIKCPKCINNYIYINLNTNKLYCLNKKCNFICDANNSNWKCNECNNNFVTNIKIFNPLEIQNVKDAIKLTLLIRKKAHPIRVLCCSDINVYNSVFYHNKNCNGVLYLGELDKNSIIICQKCKAINYFKNFIWTCPSCGKRFKENPEFYRKNINNKNEEKINDLEKKEEKKFAHSRILHLNKSLESILEKPSNKNYVLYKRNSNLDLGRNENNLLYGLNTSNTKNRKKKYILSKYLEMQISLNNNIKSNKDDTKNNLSTSINVKNNLINNDKNKNSNLIHEIKKNRNYYKNRVFIRNIINEKEIENINKNIINVNRNNNLNKSEKKEILEKENNKNLNDNKDIKNNHKRFYFKKNLDEIKNVENKKSNNKEQNILNKSKDNILNNNIKSRFAKRKYLSNEINEENTKKSNLIFYKSQNIFNIRQKYKNNYNIKSNNIDISNYNEKSSNNINANENKDNKDKDKNDKNHLQHQRLFNFYNSLSKEKDKNENKSKTKENIQNLKQSKKSDEIIYKRPEIKKLNIKDCKEIENNQQINLDSNERSKESTTDCNKSSKKLDKYIDKEEENKYIEINVIINEDNEINIKDQKKEKEKEKKIKEEMLKEILINIEKEEQLRKRPDDIMEISNILKDENFIIPVLSKTISEDEKLFKSIQIKVKEILSKGKLPLFDIKNYIIKSQIGDGSFGFIYKVIQKYTREEYAIKKIIASDIETLEEFQNEFEIVHQNPHPFILDLYGICVNVIDSDNFILYVLMDLADCDWEMEINEYLINHIYYTENQLILILKQLTSALTFLEKEKNIAHRDIKPENVLVFRSFSNDKEDIYKIADFGEAKEAKVSKQLNTLRGTELYMSPLLYNGLKEKVDDVKHDPYKSDVFSLGYCLIYAAAMNFNVIYDIRNLENKYLIKRVLKKYFNKRYSDNFIELILKMITFNEAERIDFIQLNEILKKDF